MFGNWDIEELLDGLWALGDHELPAGWRYEDLTEQLELDARPKVPWLGRDLSIAELKPNPEPLLDILDSCEVERHEAVYIGDSLTRDVLLAQRAGVADVYAAYGRSQETAAYSRLVDITHWTEADVARERKLQQKDVTPSHVLESFEELLTLVEALDRGEAFSGTRRAGAGADR